MEHFGAVSKLDLTEETRTQIARGGGNCLGASSCLMLATTTDTEIALKKCQTPECDLIV